jgi:predicted  nucleic acid-binding Zn-ribbon protein
MVSIKQIYGLQELDWEIAANETALAEARAELADNSAVVSARSRLEQLESALAEKTPMRQRSERKVRELEEKLQAVDKRLYSGSVTNPKQFTAAEEERAFLQEQCSEEENTLLELMVEVDDLSSSIEQKKKDLEQIETQRSQDETRLLKDQGRLVAELTHQGEVRAGIIPTIPPRALSVYESLLKSRGGTAVAKVERGMCQGCRIALPTLELQRARTSKDIVQCNSCRRILYVV